MRPIIVKLAKMLTDCMDAKPGLVRMDESHWEYKMLDALLTDEMAELMLKMGRRKPEHESDRRISRQKESLGRTHPAMYPNSGWDKKPCPVSVD